MKREKSLRSVIKRNIWLDAKVNSLDLSERCIYFYLLSTPRTLQCPGLLQMSELDVLAGLQLKISDAHKVTKTMKKLNELKLIYQDKEKPVIFVPEAVVAATMLSDNHIKGWYNGALEVPECEIKNKWMLSLRDMIIENYPGKIIFFDSVFMINEGNSKAVARPLEGPLNKGKGKGKDKVIEDPPDNIKGIQSQRAGGSLRMVQDFFEKVMREYYPNKLISWDIKTITKLEELVDWYGAMVCCDGMRKFVGNFEKLKKSRKFSGAPNIPLIYSCRDWIFAEFLKEGSVQITEGSKIGWQESSNIV